MLRLADRTETVWVHERGCEVSHPSGKNNDAARVGHPTFVVSHPFARNKAKGWGTGLFSARRSVAHGLVDLNSALRIR